MKRYLGVKAPDDISNPWAATSGRWVHVWLAGMTQPESGRLFAPFPAPDEIDKRVQALADERRTLLEQLCNSLGKTIPDSWTSGWLNARYLARHLGGKIAGVTAWQWVTAEHAIGRDGPVRIDAEVELQLRGRIDALFAQNNAAA